MECKKYATAVDGYASALRAQEKSAATVEKYLRDVSAFLAFLGDRAIERAALLDYKAQIAARYSPNAANSVLAAINSFLRFLGEGALSLRRLRVQKSAFCPEEREISRAEYERLVRTADSRGKRRLSLVLQTVCGTGIRISELKFITVEALSRGEACVNCKGKLRRIFIVRELRKKLAAYARSRGIVTGAVFVTRGGAPLDRSNVWRDMKALCAAARVNPKKVFPHNLRHLFARVFYELDRDISRLADVLGHSSVDTTRIYIISNGAEHKRRLERMHLIL